MREKLTSKERSRFDACKEQITSGLQQCFDTGLALIEIKEHRLYREDFDSFEDFCQQTYQIGRAYAYRLIESAEIKMSPIGDKITNERQARAIAKVPAADRESILTLAGQNGRISSESISKALQINKKVSPMGDTRHDAIGRIIPEEIIPDWDRAVEVAHKLRADASEIKVTVERGLADKDIIFAEITNPTISEASSLHYTLTQIMPYSVCPQCQGRNRKTCQLCRRRGWISKYLFNSPAVSEKTRAIIEKARK